TLRGLLIHSWERTWLYMKRAGTLILAFSILFWAGLSFPTLSDSERMRFENLRKAEIEKIRAQIGDSGPDPQKVDEQIKEALSKIDEEEAASALKASFLGRIGVWLEGVTVHLGFDYKLNLALISGAFAKEMIVSTLGTAYSMEVQSVKAYSIEERLKADPKWNPAFAFLVLIFITTYIPCIPTVLTIASELSYRWALLSVIFNLSFTVLFCMLLKKGMELFGLL
ncbi:MAG: nucleoside recognition domain-containing protein, partial [Desulfatiglandales bacterium]